MSFQRSMLCLDENTGPGAVWPIRNCLGCPCCWPEYYHHYNISRLQSDVLTSQHYHLIDKFYRDVIVTLSVRSDKQLYNGHINMIAVWYLLQTSANWPGSLIVQTWRLMQQWRCCENVLWSCGHCGSPHWYPAPCPAHPDTCLPYRRVSEHTWSPQDDVSRCHGQRSHWKYEVDKI